MRITKKIGKGLLMILKAVLWVLLTLLKILLSAVKIFLLLLGLVGRIFLAFVRAAVPD